MVTPSNIYQRPQFVQKVDSSIHWINHYPVENAISFRHTYPLDSAIQLLNDRVQNYMTGINKKTWNCESCVLEVLLVVSSEP